MARGTAVESALEELYATNLGGFIAKRDALTAALKKDGEAEAAQAVRARRKPTLIAYVLNVLARKYADEVAELVDIGRELQRAHRQALRGDPQGSLRSSIDRQRRTIVALAKKAAAVMRELEIDPSTHADEVTTALATAVIDPKFGIALEEGRLERAPEGTASFGGLAVGEGLVKETSGTHVAKKRAAEDAKAERDQKLALTRARTALRMAESDAKKKAALATKAAEEARRAVERAQELEAAANESEKRLTDAREVLEHAKAA